MMEWITSEAGMTALSVVGGWWMRHQSEKRKEVAAIHQRSIEALDTRDKSMDAAAARSKDGGTWFRRAIYFLIAFVFVSVIVAGFINTPVVHEVSGVKTAFFVFKKTFTEFVTTHGVFFPPEVRQAFLMLCGFYLGQGVK